MQPDLRTTESGGHPRRHAPNRRAGWRVHPVGEAHEPPTRGTCIEVRCAEGVAGREASARERFATADVRRDRDAAGHVRPTAGKSARVSVRRESAARVTLADVGRARRREAITGSVLAAVAYSSGCPRFHAVERPGFVLRRVAERPVVTGVAERRPSVARPAVPGVKYADIAGATVGRSTFAEHRIAHVNVCCRARRREQKEGQSWQQSHTPNDTRHCAARSRRTSGSVTRPRRACRRSRPRQAA